MQMQDAGLANREVEILGDCKGDINKQGGVVVSRWAHNSKVGGSKPLSAIFLSKVDTPITVPV